MRETAQQTQTRTAIPRPASLAIDPDRLERMWAMTPAQRRQAAQRGQLSLGEMLKWASRRPQEVPIVNGDFFFITAFLADAPRTARATRRRSGTASTRRCPSRARGRARRRPPATRPGAAMSSDDADAEGLVYLLGRRRPKGDSADHIVMPRCRRTPRKLHSEPGRYRPPDTLLAFLEGL